MNQTLTVHSPVASTAPSPFGVKDFGASTARSYSCRYTGNSGLERLNDGAEVEISSIAWVDSTGNITVQDKVTTPNGDVVPILSVETFHNELGAVDHQRLKWAR